MSKVKFSVISLVAGLVMVASLLTVGLLTGVMWPYILALWMSVVLIMSVIGVILRMYRRLMTRVRGTHEQLLEMKLLQEKRYEQLAKRLDNLSSGALNRQESVGHTVLGGSSGTQLSVLEHLIARAERAERRIVGRLENLTFDYDRCCRAVKQLATDGENLGGSR